MRTFPLALIATMTLFAATAGGQQTQRDPELGYIYPAGARQGSVVQLLVGGQRLNNLKEIHVTGEGVRAKLIRFMGNTLNLNGDERRELLRQLVELKSDAAREFIERYKIELPDKDKIMNPDKEKEEVTLPKHPMLSNLDRLGVMELEFLVSEILRPDNKKQLNAQIGETALIEVTVAPDAAPGDRELRLLTPLGLTNPLCFQVGTLPEVREQEPIALRPQQGGGKNPAKQREGRERKASDSDASAMPPSDLPVTINGQIKPGDIDRFRFRAKEGEQLVIEAQARHLIPFLADAVPGWFQAVLILHDDEGKEVAFADDHRFNPDPVIFYRVPKAGVYELEIRDALYRGRLDFVYRISIGEEPFIRSIFPLGGREGVETAVAVDGWNLATTTMPLETRPGADPIREAVLRKGDRLSNRVLYAVDTLPECAETEPNDSPKDAQRVALPTIVNGRIGSPGDIDVFRFDGKAGDEVVAEVVARRLSSPLDSFLRLSDATGNVLAWNDDRERKEGHLYEDPGAITHHSDSFLLARLPKDGVYCVQLADSQQQGGREYGYRLRIGPPRPDFSLCVSPSSLNLRGGLCSPITVYALRDDGFDGEIALSLKDAPTGFALQGATIPAGRNSVRITLSSPPERADRPISLQLEGCAQIDNRTVRRPALPAEDVMQAFLYRHLLPSRELLVAIVGRGPRKASAEMASKTPILLPAGGTADALFKVSGGVKIENLRFKLVDPPPGIALLESIDAGEGSLKLVLKTDPSVVKVGFEDNLIVEVIAEVDAQPKGEKATPKKNRVSAGVLPAIPVKIVQ